MTTDLDQRLAALRPAPHWTDAERAAVLDRVLANPADTPIPFLAWRRRRSLALAITGLVAAVAVAVPILLPAGSPGGADPAAARALGHLAHVAAGGPDLHLAPGQYIHLVLTSHQNPTPGQPTVDSRYESWTDATGRTWQVRDDRTDWAGAEPTTTSHEVWLIEPGRGIGDVLTQRDLEKLPSDPAKLRAYLDEHGEHANSTDERIFLGVGTILRGGMAPPALRSAAIQVLAGLRHVTIGATTTDANGNPVQEFVFADPATRKAERWALLFDTRTAQITEERQDFKGKLLYRGDVTGLDVVDSLPAVVRAEAKPVN
ncbi:MAG TPA: CU044_5270 family protein [Jatrophihabitans sp.]|nr:CU044_5270 family protein [Jatrophihabitans sp.]